MIHVHLAMYMRMYTTAFTVWVAEYRVLHTMYCVSANVIFFLRAELIGKHLLREFQFCSKKVIDFHTNQRALRLQTLAVLTDHISLKVGHLHMIKCSHMLCIKYMVNWIRFRMGASITSSAPEKCRREVSMLTNAYYSLWLWASF